MAFPDFTKPDYIYAMSTIPILILAAGRSTRMRGADKLLEPVEGQPCLKVMVERALATGQPVIVTLPDPQHPRHDVVRGLSITRVFVPDAGLGMSRSLQRGVAALPPGVYGAMILPADMPAITTADMTEMAEEFALVPCDALQAGTSDMRAGHPTILGPGLLNKISTLSGDRGAAVLIKDASYTRMYPLPGDRARLDLDTPEDWQAWRARNL